MVVEYTNEVGFFKFWNSSSDNVPILH